MNMELSFNNERPGVFCTDHKSVYCAHAVEHIGARHDAAMIEALITEGVQTTSGTWNATLAVPIYPQYCVWEKVVYKSHDASSPFGPHLEVKVGEENWTNEYLQTLARILPGDSLVDLSAAVRMNFEPEAEGILDGFKSAAAPRNIYRCESRTHSFKYNSVMQKVLDPATIRECKADGDITAQLAMLFCLKIHKQCMLCYVNANFRDALRVVPSMEAWMKEDATGDFSDLVADATTAKKPSVWAEDEVPF